MITYSEAIATVEKAGIPGRCAYVRAGDAYDYQGVAGVPLSVPRPLYPGAHSDAWEETNYDVLEWNPTPGIGTRRFVICETILDEPDRTATIGHAFDTFNAAGWEGIGSGGFRIEVDPATVPEDEDPFKNYDTTPIQEHE